MGWRPSTSNGIFRWGEGNYAAATSLLVMRLRLALISRRTTSIS